jgi:hypothetical protein
MTDDEIDGLIEPILKAAGTSLRNYTMWKTRDDMRKAMRAALAAKLSEAHAGAVHFPSQSGEPQDHVAVTFSDIAESKIIFTIGADGVVTLGDGVSMDEATQAFWRSVQVMGEKLNER